VHLANREFIELKRITPQTGRFSKVVNVQLFPSTSKCCVWGENPKFQSWRSL